MVEGYNPRRDSVIRMITAHMERELAAHEERGFWYRNLIVNGYPGLSDVEIRRMTDEYLRGERRRPEREEPPAPEPEREPEPRPARHPYFEEDEEVNA